MGRNGSTLIVLLCSLLLLSCSFAPEGTFSRTRPAEFPDMLLSDARYLLGLEGSDPIFIEAREIEIYREAQKTYITEARFSQTDKAGNITFSGSFGAAVADTKTHDMLLSDSVVIDNRQERFTIVAETLQWNHAEQTVVGGPDTLVTITRNEHDILRGTGFHGDFATSTFEFLTMEEGTIYYE